jgi:2'-5' RNA ligase
MVGIAFHPTLYYSPDQWVPHITLAYNDVTSANIDCVMQSLAFQTFNWEIQIDNLILVAQAEGHNTAPVRVRLGL